MNAFRIIFAATILLAACGLADAAAPQRENKSITESSVHLPTQTELLRVLLLRDYNTRVVVLGTALLGLAAGTIGAFMLLRKRALMGDALSHATLPGIALAFMFSVAAGGTGKSLSTLLTGAVITGVLGVLAVAGI